MDKKLFIFVIGIFLISSIYFITPITFTTGTYIEMYPAFRGTVCILQDNSCISGTEKTIDFALAKVLAENPRKTLQDFQLRYDNCISEEGSCEESIISYYREQIDIFSSEEVYSVPQIPMMIFENINYRGTGQGNLDSNIDYRGDNYQKLLDAQNNFTLGNMNLLNSDGTEIQNIIQIIYTEDNPINPQEVSELIFNLNGQIYTLISIENEVTEPITYTFEG